MILVVLALGTVLSRMIQPSGWVLISVLPKMRGRRWLNLVLLRTVMTVQKYFRCLRGVNR